MLSYMQKFLLIKEVTLEVMAARSFQSSGNHISHVKVENLNKRLNEPVPHYLSCWPYGFREFFHFLR